jgi:hypothetical protein
MRITREGTTQLFTGADLMALTVRFEVRSERGHRTFLVDGVRVTEAEYMRAVWESRVPARVA